MRQTPGESVPKLCPRCGTLAFIGDRRCPWCGAGYRRRIWPALLTVALVQTVLLLGGVAYMLTLFGDELDATLDRRVERVQRDLDDSFDDVRQSVREELDRRLPAPAPAP